MRKNHIIRLLLAAMLVLTLALAACGTSDNDNNNNNNNDPNEEEPDNNNNNNEDGNDDSDEEETKGDEILSRFNQTVENDGEPLDDGHLQFGVVHDDPFTGVFNFNFYSDAYDAEFINWFDESLLGMDGDFLYDQTGAATFEHNEDGDVFTFELEEGIKYHDGEEVTVNDWVFAHEVIADPEYTGVRYDATIENVEGIDEYHDGEADEISGLEVIDDYTLEMTFKEATPSLLAGGIWTYVLPEHIFGDMEVSEMEDSDAVRQNPIGFGPYKVDTIVDGESVTYTKFEDYWRGEPALEKVTAKIIAESNAGKAIETGEVDMLDSFPATQYAEYEDLDNVEFIARKENYFSYIGFNLGDWDEDEGEVNMKDDMKMADPELRKAMAHAIDADTAGEEFYNDLAWGANSLIDPGHRLYYDPTWEGFDYDPEKAEQILDDAGYEYDGDYRTTPDGEELVINYAGMDQTSIAEPEADFFMQSWAEIGLNVELVDGRLLEFNDFYDRVGEVGNDDPDIDVFKAAFGSGSNVDPSGLYGRGALFNFARYASDENDELIADGLSEEAFDLDYRQDVYAEWHELMQEDVPVAPYTFRIEVTPVNKRVTNYTVDPDINDMFQYEIGVTEDEPLN